MANALKTCPCAHRIASQCPGEWEPGCDLGANPAHVRVARTQPPSEVEAAAEADDAEKAPFYAMFSAAEKATGHKPSHYDVWLMARGLMTVDGRASQPAAVVYPPDGTVSPFTVINLGAGLVQMGDSIHDGRLPALWFGKNGQGMGHEEELNRQAYEGETLAVVTFANVEGLDVLLDVIQRIRRVSFPGAAEAPHG